MHELIFLLFLACCLIVVIVSEEAQATGQYDHLFCRDPSSGGGHHDILNRKFLVLSGLGGGLGNYLSFYPAAYYFAAVTGRVRLIAFVFNVA
jgi:hypothetical protein